MGLFDKVLKDVISKASETVDKVQESGVIDSAFSEAKNLFEDAKDAVAAFKDKEEGAPAENAQPFTGYDTAAEGPSGFSWGAAMPDEPNQYNYNGPWQSYFEEVFKENFPKYEILREKGTRGGEIFMFRSGGRIVLYVEVMNTKSEANTFRARCKAAGIPYVRFYFNHEGWWNTKEYVCLRVGKALET